MIKKLFFICFLFVVFISNSYPQNYKAPPHINFTRQDTLRGSITPERSWWDLNYYHLDIKVNIDQKFIEGKNTVRYKVISEYQILQIDLQKPMKILSVKQDGKELKVKREEIIHFIELIKKQEIGKYETVEIMFAGKPIEAANPPWDGGITWQKDINGNPFVASACQGIGASVWWPCKDHPADEVDSILISVNIPKNLMNISNGKLRNIESFKDKTKTFHWFVSNPINSYGVNINIGNYAHFSEKYAGEKGDLNMDYYVIKHNLKKAKKQFKEAVRTIQSMEYWFGPYPFYEDGYKLVEVPYLGMEHQSSVTYGNGFINGYKGIDLSGTGQGMKFDFIIVHESGHEWFANNITSKDKADMWIHESFTCYSESLFLEYHFGKEAGNEYVIGLRKNIQNQYPVIGIYGVNNEGFGGTDMYYKGANMLHTLREIVNDDDKWRKILRQLNKIFYHQTVTTQQIENYIGEQINVDLTPFFNQYLRDNRVPVFEYYQRKKELFYRWMNVIDEFNMPLKISIAKKEVWIKPTIEWKDIKITESSNIVVDENFYIGVMN